MMKRIAAALLCILLTLVTGCALAADVDYRIWGTDVTITLPAGSYQASATDTIIVWVTPGFVVGFAQNEQFPLSDWQSALTGNGYSTGSDTINGITLVYGIKYDGSGYQVLFYYNYGSYTYGMIASGVNYDQAMSFIEDVVFTLRIESASTTTPEPSAGTAGLTIENGVVTGYTGTATSVTIPYGVTEIGNSAFRGTGITSVTIPNSVTEIAYSAFANCTQLQSVVIPGSVETIGSYAFEKCSALTSLTLEEGMKNLGVGSFGYCTSLREVEIPSSAEGVDSYIFRGCTSLRRVIIKDGPGYIFSSAFADCTSLESITIPESVTYFTSGCIPSAATVYCNTGSKAAAFALTNGNAVVYLDAAEPTPTPTPTPSPMPAGTEYPLLDSGVSIVLPEGAEISSSSDTSISIDLSELGLGVGFNVARQSRAELSSFASILYDMDFDVSYSSINGIQNINGIKEKVSGSYTFYSYILIFNGDNYSYQISTGLLEESQHEAIMEILGTMRRSSVVTPTPSPTSTPTPTPAPTAAPLTQKYQILGSDVAVYLPADMRMTSSTATSESWREPYIGFTVSDTEYNFSLYEMLYEDMSVNRVTLDGIPALLIFGYYEETGFQILMYYNYGGKGYMITGLDLTQDEANVVVQVLDTMHVSVVEPEVTVTPEPTSEPTYVSVFTLPADLESIEAEAFMSAAADRIILPEGCVAIASRAFASCEDLRRVDIPATVTEIADDAFSGSDSVVIYAPEGCKAQTYAQEHEIEFVAAE